MGIALSQVGKGPKSNLTTLTSWSGDVSDGKAEIANAGSFPLLRVAQQASVSLATPTEHANIGQGWRIPSAENIGGFSAVCWMFGRRLQQHLNVAVGLVQNQVGGTAVERWSSAAALATCDQSRGDRMAVCASSDEPRGWESEPLFVEAEAEGENATLFNGMIAPWLHTAVRGTIWYQ